MTEEERSDIVALQKRMDAIRKNGWGALYHVRRSKECELKQRGYKTVSDALMGTFDYYQAQLHEQLKAHFKKWPD